MIPHNRVLARRSDAVAMARTVLSGQWAQGQRVIELEARLAALAGMSHAVCVGSGLAALRLALMAIGVGRDDPVLVPAYCCVALPNAVLSLGASPVAVGIQADTWNLDAQACPAACRAIIAVDTFGYPAEVEALEARAPVVEDCSHAFGRRPFGGRSRVAVLSFYATKLIGAGEGGAVLTQDGDLAATVREWRDYSDKTPDGTRLNDKMTDLEATLALCQLDRLEQTLASRRRLAEAYHQALADHGAIRLPIEHPDRIWYRYAIECLHEPATTVMGRLRQQGVQTALPVTPWGDVLDPTARRAYGSLLSIPLYPGLSDADQATVIAALRHPRGE